MELATRRRGVRYPEEDHVGEHALQRLIAELLRPLVARWLAARGERACVGADQFFYWEDGNPVKRIAPDVYVVPGADPATAVGVWKTWELAKPPSFALEIAGDDLGKDYDENPALYAELGVRELVIFDPWATPRSRRRVRWQVYRRLAKRGLVRVEVSSGDRVRSKVLGAWLRLVGSGDARRLRLGLAPDGEALFPTADEAERERAEAERERADRAEAELARLREELRRRGGA